MPYPTTGPAPAQPAVSTASPSVVGQPSYGQLTPTQATELSPIEQYVSGKIPQTLTFDIKQFGYDLFFSSQAPAPSQGSPGQSVVPQGGTSQGYAAPGVIPQGSVSPGGVSQGAPSQAFAFPGRCSSGSGPRLPIKDMAPREHSPKRFPIKGIFPRGQSLRRFLHRGPCPREQFPRAQLLRGYLLRYMPPRACPGRELSPRAGFPRHHLLRGHPPLRDRRQPCPVLEALLWECPLPMFPSVLIMSSGRAMRFASRCGEASRGRGTPKWIGMATSTYPRLGLSASPGSVFRN